MFAPLQKVMELDYALKLLILLVIFDKLYLRFPFF